MPREERATSMDRWSEPLLGGRSRAELPGAGEQGSQGGLRSKGSLRGMRSGEGSYSPGGLPYKEENTGSAMIGVQGLRVSSWLDGEGSVSAPDWTAWMLARLWGLSVALCWDMSRHAQACLNMPDLALTFHQQHKYKLWTESVISESSGWNK